MSQRAEAKQDRIDELVVRVREHVDAAEQETVSEWVRFAFAGAAHDDLRERSLDELATLALALFGIVRQRDVEHPFLRVFDPQDEGLDWAEGRTVIQVASRDMPFLVDSFSAELGRRGLTIHMALHPQLAAQRSADGALESLRPLGSTEDGVTHESVMYFEIDRLPSQSEQVELETALRKVLQDVEIAVTEWRPMRDACFAAIERLRKHPPAKDSISAGIFEETIDFLRWVAEDHFTFLGSLEYDLEERDGQRFLCPDRSSGLGLLHAVPLQDRAAARRPLAAEALRFIEGPELVMISKTSQHSTVHRNVHMDVVSLKRFDAEGRIDGEIRFIGLFTSMAYSIAARNIPLVRQKVQRVIDRTRFLPASHNVKVLRHIVEHYPRDELFQISEDDLFSFSMRILELQLRPRLALLVRRDEEERFVSCMVYVPRDLHNTEVRLRIQRTLELAFAGRVTAYYTRLSDRPLAQLQFIVKTKPGHIPEYDVEVLEQRLTEAVKSWEDRLREALDEASDEASIDEWRRYRDAFPPAYQQFSTPSDAVEDIPRIDQVAETGQLGMRLYRRPQAADRRFHLRTFERGVQLPLSDLLPMLENMGLEVISEFPSEVRPQGEIHTVWIRDFEVTTVAEVDLDEEARGRFVDTLRSVYRGTTESDGFNRLVLGAGLDERRAMLLRAYCRYLRQTGIPFGQAYMSQTLASNPRIAALLVELFEAHFDPRPAEEAGSREERIAALEAGIVHALEAVRNADDDRILRRFWNLIDSTLRTNFFQHDAAGRDKPYVSFKFDGAKVLELRRPRPAFEIFVYSPRVEAVHLRGGMVARGGIRWSDRPEDFRTEVLGLVKSQMVKNAVIVPVGAKGGFVVKQPPSGGRDEVFEEGRACYETMIRGMLDLTDNLQDGAVVPAPSVVRRDGDDPYLVVAADKGTATFSDTANAISAEYGFWLGDAFASGGSKGYDHKKMGITARGAWVSVERHFREMGRDIQTEPFTCVGVGDMSGDVFGNGMLLSPVTRLVAAFNHLHVFVDPDPDPARSLAERRRLFELPRSSWADYDPAALSEGGAVFDRSEKRIEVSPEIVAALGLAEAQLSPDELIQAILRAKVDLLWFGGIGTYVKASHQSDADVDDRANDEVRIDAAELGVLVVGEGANLGLTQAGRIEFAARGGRLNTDFIDNSGGVDCSDHEVNIKIALDRAVEGGDFDCAARDQLLVEMTEDVAQLVLRDNYLQSLAISLIEMQRGDVLDDQARLMRDLERLDRLDRRLEFLPDDTTLAERRQAKEGLTRPEIAVLLAYSKSWLYDQLLASSLPDDPLLVDDLGRYFPPQMRDRFKEAIAAHRLRREILATDVVNSLVNRVGATFVTRMMEETGRSAADVTRAYLAARDLFDLRSLWNDLAALDNQIPTDLQYRALQSTVGLLAVVIRWVLRHAGDPLDLPELLRQSEREIVVVAAQLEDLLPSNARQRTRRKEKRLREAGMPEHLANRIALLDTLPAACEVARNAIDTGVAVERVGKVYFTVGERFGFDRLRRAAAGLVGDSPYTQAATTAIVDDLAQHQSRITAQVVQHQGRAKAAIDAWSAERPDAVRRLERLRDDFDATGHADLALLAVAEREMRRIAWD